MSDFFQNGYISTLHNLSTRSLEQMEQELEEFSVSNPMGLILPSLYSELQQAALGTIVDELKFDFNCQYEEKDSIGKRYRRQDAIGTPFCITVDHQTLEDDTVTIRYRDTMEQDRVDISTLREIIKDRVDISVLLKQL